MNQHTSSPHRAGVVRTSFEPSHLAAACMVDAYEYVVPVVQRSLPQRLPDQPERFSTRAKRHVSAGGGSS